MYDWIALDGIKSTEIKNLVVMSYTPLYLPTRSREETVLPGRLTAVTQRAWQREPAEIPITLAVIGLSQAEVHRRFREQVLPWLYSAERLSLDIAPDRFYRGAITQVTEVEDENTWIRVEAVFRCNPPCGLQLMSGQAGWFPAADRPIPQQLNDQNATASGSFSREGWLTAAGYTGLETAETYLAVTGTWRTLKLGDSFQVLKAVEEASTLYIDSENDQVWMCEADGTEVNWMGATTGETPEIGPGHTQLYVGGEGIQVLVQMLVIARG